MWMLAPRGPRAVLGSAVACVLLWAVPAALLHGYARSVATTSARTLGMAAAAAVAVARGPCDGRD